MVNSALGMAIEARNRPNDTLVHSDHGPQFTSWTFSARVREAGLVQSFESVGAAVS
jgi:transposase InsO family protein